MNRNARSVLTHYLLVFLLVLAAGVAHAESPVSVHRATFEGTIGQSKIGMTLLIDSNGAVTGGHYFYAKYLKDIPLKAGTQGTGIILYEPEGGQFALRLKGEAGKPLSFQNSTGMEGRWMKGASSYPVELHIEGITEGFANARWYQDVTTENDASFETQIQSFCKAVIAGDRATAARFVEFPFRVNRNGKSSEIRSAGELSSQWNQIFTPACIEAIKNAMPHDIFVRNGQAMLGNGILWFGPKGAHAINIP